MSPDDCKKRVRTHIDLSWNKGRLALAEQLQSKYFTYKSSLALQPLDSAGFAQIVRDIREAMPDLEVVIDECLSEGNKVVTSSTLIGTLVKPAFGRQPSDKIMAIAAMSIWTLNPAGDIEELNSLFDLDGGRSLMPQEAPLAQVQPLA
ncbi:ester cyclase [Stutzerimonas azotifigens]|uniref:SnoaL-like domain-containing protein n=1 Tax=Stutzerimonas azotifigens TaxID=291995 RepID=A0ABR5YVU0_9GAMM|nr:ester cyclase [Stutzerimonas azotifigens]MBA1272041.1 SnoaL-like domain-containing protein [Stutzerimonas azotifigens]